jgi:hypothetical protein
MSEPKPKSEGRDTKQKPAGQNDPDRKKAEPPAGELLEGDGSPGLTIMGGGGHA